MQRERVAEPVKRDIGKYESAYLADYDFESVLVAYRRRLLLERLAARAPRTVVEVGCGDDLLYAHHVAQGNRVGQWIVVEPGQRFVEGARAQKDRLPNLEVVQGFLEDEVETVRSLLGGAPYLVVCSGLLHEVADARRLLTRIVDVMDACTSVHVSVPNASSPRGVENVNLPNAMGWTPLINAAYGGELRLCELLLDAGADVNLPNPNGTTPLMYAKEHAERSGNFGVTALLLARGGRRDPAGPVRPHHRRLREREQAGADTTLPQEGPCR